VIRYQGSNIRPENLYETQPGSFQRFFERIVPGLTSCGRNALDSGAVGDLGENNMTDKIFLKTVRQLGMSGFITTSVWKRPGVARLGLAALLMLCGPSLVYAQLAAADIATMKQAITNQKYTFTVDENPATKIPLSQLCGTIPSLAPKSANTLSSKALVAETALPSYWDWRQHNGVTPVKNQGGCGSCWAFSTVGTMEAMILIGSGITTDLSEQQLVSCNPYGWGCGGGNYAFDMEISPGAMLESCFSYQAADVACQSGCPSVYWLSSWGYVGDSWSVPSTTAIKNAIYTYGPISVEVAVDGYFQGYSGGVFNATTASSIDHAVVLVGWDDTNGCWIMKNSWGTGWGESGYMRIAYGCDLIGYGAAYAMWMLPEPLRITPATGFTSTGGAGGPFTIISQSLTLTNAGTNSLTWTLANTSVWLNASPQRRDPDAGRTYGHGEREPELSREQPGGGELQRDRVVYESEQRSWPGPAVYAGGDQPANDYGAAGESGRVGGSAGNVHRDRHWRATVVLPVAGQRDELD
jgi:C1A family cysteine protease